jgi:ubiquinone/menaquinone biosynthesis C-methylase UbiE
MSRVRDIWDDGAPIYDQIYANNVPYHRSHAVIVDLLPTDRPIEVIDLGAGTGLLAERILKGLPQARVTCVEFSPQMIKQSKQRLSSATESVRFVCADINTWEPKQEYDAVVSCNSLVYRDIDLPRCYARYAGVLKSDGILLNSTVVNTPELPAFAGLAQRIPPPGGQPPSQEVLDFSKTTGRDIAHFGDDSLAVARTVEEHIALLSAAGLNATCAWQYLAQVIIAGVKT